MRGAPGAPGRSAPLFAHVLERLLDDARDLPAHAGRQVHVLDRAVEDRVDPGVPAEAGHRRVEEADQLLRRDLDGLQALHRVAQLQDLAPEEPLDAHQVGRHL
jgi:hypothetical protein